MGALLMAISAVAKPAGQSSDCLAYSLMYWRKVWFVRSAWPFAYGWNPLVVRAETPGSCIVPEQADEFQVPIADDTAR